MKKIFLSFTIASFVIMLIVLQSCYPQTAPKIKSKPEIKPKPVPIEEKTSVLPTPVLLYPENNHIFDADASVYLKWKASSGDNLSYDIYFGQNTLSLYASNLQSTIVYVPTEPHSSYKWKVVVKDNNGNSNCSEIRHFLVKCRGWR